MYENSVSLNIPRAANIGGLSNSRIEDEHDIDLININSVSPIGK